jgi:Uma2 family endonuclease
MVVDRPAVVEHGNGVPNEPIWRLGVEQYHAMVVAGILDEDAPVELLEGWLVVKCRKSPPHSVSKGLLYDIVRRLMPPDSFLCTVGAVTTTDSEPEPDLMVIWGDPERYAEHHPGPGDVPLVVEVADSSLRRDRQIKKRVYARAGIPVYWIVNLVDRRIEVYTLPGGPTAAPDYAERRDYAEGEAVPVVIEGREVGRVAVGAVLR